jgi:threonine/homoserine/homoserine lactone efflux protein
VIPLFDASSLVAYAAASVVLVVAPGPGQALVLTRTLQGGARAGVATAAGLEIGTLIHTLCAALGLSAVLATSATAFAVLKYVGAAYLVWLGISALRGAGREPESDGVLQAVAASRRRLVLHAAVTGTLNPKVALFFLAFLPQFVDPARGHVLVQFLVLGVGLATLGFVWDSTLAAAAGRARGRLLESRRFRAWRDRITGTVLIALGLRLAIAERS